MSHLPPVPMRSVLYLDLDGTVRKGFDELGRWVNGPEDVEIFPEVPALLKMYRAAGWAIVAISNQGGVALGHVTPEAVAQGLKRTFVLCDGGFDLMFTCNHHPDAPDPSKAHCLCRKPRYGLIAVAQAMLNGSAKYTGNDFPPNMALLVGDREEDRLCAENAGIKFQWAADWRTRPLLFAPGSGWAPAVRQ